METNRRKTYPIQMRVSLNLFNNGQTVFHWGEIVLELNSTFTTWQYHKIISNLSFDITHETAGTFKFVSDNDKPKKEFSY